LDWVSEFVDWVGLDLAKWTHVQLWSSFLGHWTDSSTVDMLTRSLLLLLMWHAPLGQELTECWSAKTQEPSGQTVQTGSSNLQSVPIFRTSGIHQAYHTTIPALHGCQLKWGLSIRPVSRDVCDVLV